MIGMMGDDDDFSEDGLSPEAGCNARNKSAPAPAVPVHVMCQKLKGIYDIRQGVIHITNQVWEIVAFTHETSQMTCDFNGYRLATHPCARQPIGCVCSNLQATTAVVTPAEFKQLACKGSNRHWMNAILVDAGSPPAASSTIGLWLYARSIKVDDSGRDISCSPLTARRLAARRAVSPLDAVCAPLNLKSHAGMPCLNHY